MPTQPTRRTFLKLSAAAASLSAAEFAHAVPPAKRIAIVTDDDSPLINNEPVRWAAEKLRAAITPQGLSNKQSGADFTLLIAPVTSPLAKSFPNRPRFTQPETTALIPGHFSDIPSILVTGIDTRDSHMASLNSPNASA